ncbi:SDR family oxidoreductase [bacterium]|nr:MAG: SDR family oxidoreductase [bacterium]
MKNVVVTGANRGLGRELVRQLRARGDRVFAGCRQPTDEVATEGAEPMTLDVASQESIARFVEDLKGRTGRIDLLIHNAGIPHAGEWKTSEGYGSLEFEALEKVMRTNGLGPLLLTQACYDLLKGTDRPIVAGITSFFSSLGGRNEFFANNFGYSMSKVSMNMWLRSLALLKKDEGLRTVVLDPGWVKTDMGGPDAPLTPEQVVAGCLDVIDGLTDEQSGTYIAWDGKPLPW